MNANFWHQKWERGEIGFHNHETNPLLTEHFGKLNLPTSSRIFLPLCGKTRDISWLLNNGYQLVGAELSELAVTQLFEDLAVVPTIMKLDKLIQYSATNIDIFVGDIFDISGDILGHIDAIYDRAAIVALPADMREKYTSHLRNITDAAPQFIITYEYEQQLMDGPPFSVTVEEITQHYGTDYIIKPLAFNHSVEKFKGKVDFTETVLLLQK